MTEIPEAAIEAAAQAMAAWWETTGLHFNGAARAALEAAMPAIREALAQEVEAHAGWTPHQPPWWAVAMEQAARIFRGAQ